MRYLLLPLILLLFAGLQVKATIIKCEDPRYVGQKLDFYKYSDPVTQTKELVFTLNFDSKGNCSENIYTKTVLYVFCDFGIYRGMLFIEPNQSITLKLPPLRNKSFADQKNPFFEPVGFWFLTDSNSQLNNQISDFTNQFNQSTDKYFNQLYFRQSQEILDSVVLIVNSRFDKIGDKTFLMHKDLSLKLLEVDIFRKKPEEYCKIFSKIDKNYWLNPSFISLFEKAFGNQLSFKAKAIKGKELNNAVESADINYVLKYVKSTYNINDEIAELVLLKMLHDGFYSGDFSKSPLQRMVKDKLFTQNSNQIIKKAATLVSQKFSFMQTGTKAPVICLNQINGDNFCSDETGDKFKYILFVDTEMIVCREHLKYLFNINQRFQEHLEIIIVFRDTGTDEIKKFLSENDIPGIKLLDSGIKFSEIYKIRSYPQCFLLDENHKVQFATAYNPMDGFEQQFGVFLQHELFERLRNQSR